MSDRDATRVHAGDTVTDPLGQTNRVIDTRGGRLLLEDPNGFRFILSAYRLRTGWQHTSGHRRATRDQRPSRGSAGRHAGPRDRSLAELRFAPMPNRRRDRKAA